MSESIPNVQPFVTGLRPYVPGMSIDELARTYSLAPDSIVKLASNENPSGPSQLALDAASTALGTVNLYPDIYIFQNTVAAYHSVSSDMVVVGNGTNDILDLIARVFLGAGTESLMYEHSFLVYKLVSTMVGARVIETKANQFGYDLDLMTQSITDKTRVVWIDNPNNPTGTCVDYGQLESFIKRVPTTCIVVIDEAYVDYLPDDVRVDTIQWISHYPNVIVTRTFSKIHALAGLRIGYAIASPTVAELLNRVRQPFSANSAGLAAASASLNDHAHIVQSRTLNTASLQAITTVCDELGIDYITPHGNFITISTDRFDNLHEDLLQRGIITRPIANYYLPSHLRITSGSHTDTERLVEALRELARKD